MNIANIQFDETTERNNALAVIEKLNIINDTLKNTIITSRELNTVNNTKLLNNLIPPSFDGVERVFFPFAFAMPSGKKERFLIFRTDTATKAKIVQKINRSKAGLLKFILSGTVVVNEQQFSTGDWFWISQGKECEIFVGDEGASILTLVPHFPSDTVQNCSEETTVNRCVTSKEVNIIVNDEIKSLFNDLHEDGENLQFEDFPFTPLMPNENMDVGHFFLWQATIAPDTHIPGHIHELEQIADFKFVIEGSIDCNGHTLTKGD